MLESGSMDRIKGFLKKEDFYEPKNSIIYETIDELYEARSVYDMSMVAAALTSAGNLEKIGGEHYLMEVGRILPYAEHLKDYSKRVREKSLLRKLLSVAGKISETVSEYDKEAAADAMKAVDKCSQDIYLLARDEAGRELVPVSEILKDVYANLHKVSNHTHELLGVTTGFNKLDERTNGLQNSNLIIVAGRPSMGKTSFAVNMAQNAALAGKTVAIFTLEMSAEQIVHKLISFETGIRSGQLQSGPLGETEWLKLAKAGDPLTELKIYIDDSSQPSAMEINSKCRRLKNTPAGLDLVVIDYLQLMATQSKNRSDSRANEVSEITRSLKAMAKDLKVPVVALSQLSRASETRKVGQKRPILSDLRESGSIEQDADIVLFVHRENYYAVAEKQSAEEFGTAETAEIIIGKNRTGPTGTVELTFTRHDTKFQDID
jgi:replicative DNA helicase